jgi:predicted O-methyltransferase YrrM
MTTLFVARGLLRRSGDTLELTPQAREHLVASSTWSLLPYFPPVTDRPIALDLIEVLRHDRPANFASRKDTADWHKAMETEAVAREFTAAMDCRGRLLAQALAARLDLGSQHRLLDVAGGSGIYACGLAARFPGLTGSVFEKQPVDRIARNAIESRGYASRIDVIAGDMLTEALPTGYDVHLWSNVLHDWDVPIVKQLLHSSARALAPGGTVIIHEAFLNADKTGSAEIAAYSVLLLHVTQGRCYSVAELTEWMREAGFGEPAHVASAVGRSALVARKT